MHFVNLHIKGDLVKHWMLLLTLILLILLPWKLKAQDSAYTMTGFPLGTGRSVDASFWQPHAKYLHSLQDTLQEDSLARIKIRTTADLSTFATQNDPNNAATALSRYHAVVSYLVDVVGISREKILPPLTDEPNGHGPEFRIAQVWIERVHHVSNVQPPSPEMGQTTNLMPSDDDLTEAVKDSSESDSLTLAADSCCFSIIATLDAGATWTQFNKAAFLLRGSVGSSRLRFDAEFGFTPLSNSWQVGTETYDANFTLIAGHVLYSLSDSSNWELFTGIERHEERSPDFGQHFRRRQGFVFGAGCALSKDVALRASWGVLEERRFDYLHANWLYDQFRITLYLTLFGG